MEKTYSFCTTIFIFLALICVETAANGYTENTMINKNNHHKRKLFVFGDSYADTGNLGKLGRGLTNCWYSPYGSTFPSKPTGRFSDGRILTDFVAAYMGIKSPIPYKYRKFGKKLLPYGMNFAVGGSGVFDTLSFQRNITAQIDNFQAQIDEGFFSKRDIRSSVALIVISGNDYSTLRAINPDFLKGQNLRRFMHRFFVQLRKDITRLKSIGVSKVIIPNLHPLSCIPTLTKSSNYTICPSNYTNAAIHHNLRFRRMVKSLNRASKHKFVVPLDIFTAISNIVHQENGAPKFEYPLVPCCEGIADSYSCGEEDENGNKLYKQCSNPSLHFYWDSAHPTQAGWDAVFKHLLPSLEKALH